MTFPMQAASGMRLPGKRCSTGEGLAVPLANDTDVETGGVITADRLREGKTTDLAERTTSGTSGTKETKETKETVKEAKVVKEDAGKKGDKGSPGTEGDDPDELRSPIAEEMEAS